MRKKSSIRKANIFDEIKVVRDEEGDIESLDEIEEESENEENIQGFNNFMPSILYTMTTYSYLLLFRCVALSVRGSIHRKFQDIMA